MVVKDPKSRCGVVSMDRQVETVPGPQPQRGPPPATGISDPKHVAGKGQSKATGYNLRICHWNAEGVMPKKLDLQTFLKHNNVDVCCIQETHMKKDQRFHVRGYEPFKRPRETGPKGGILTLVKNTYPAIEIHRSTDTEDTEVLGVKLLLEEKPLSIYNVYSPPSKMIDLHSIQPEAERWIIVGDFNSHSPSWGYPDLDPKGEEVEDWIITNQMVLINHPDDPHTYYSRAWRTTSCPDLAIATDDVAKIAYRQVEQQLGGSDHKPVLLHIKHEQQPTNSYPCSSWNYKKANWTEFQRKADQNCRDLNLKQQSMNTKAELITAAILKAANETIPRGRRQTYIPGWNQQLQELHETVSELRDQMEQCPTDENVAAHEEAKEIFAQQKLQQTREAWHEKTSSLNMEKDSYKLWKLTKLLNDDNPGRRQTVIEANGELLTKKKAANCLAEHYQKESSVKLPRERTRQVRAESTAAIKNQKSTNNCMDEAITLKEVEAAIKGLKCKKAPGPDGVSNDMIRHLGPVAKKTLLELFNESWKTGSVPAMWKKAIIIPIHKQGKDKKNPNSYRPISLLSCLGKLMERVINRRLLFFLENNNILSPTQTGYRRHRSTEDQLALIAQEIENAFQEKKKTVTVFFDMTKAFDKVWREGLLLKVLQCGVSGRMYGWIRCFLHDRSARVRLDGCLGESVKMREGVPQGGVISPTLFLIYINDITTVIPRHVSNTLHADDLAVWSAAEHTTSAAHRIQGAVQKIHQWTEDWGLQISEVKTQTTVFSLSTSKEKVTIKLGDKILPQVETPTFLGVKLDTRLTWKPHIEDMEAKGIRKLGLLKKLSGTTWGANTKVLKTVYTGTVRPVLEYGASAWGTAAKTHTNKLDKVQNIGLRTVLGAMKTTPIATMEKTSGIEPLEHRRQAKLLIHAEKIKRLPDHPLHDRLQDLTKNRLKRKSLNHLVKEQQRSQADILTADPALCERLVPTHWPPDSLQAEVRTEIPGIIVKEKQCDAALRALTLEEIDRSYPTATWTRIYTDGSAENATRNGGCGVYIKRPGMPPLSMSAPSGRLCSNYKAEVLALHNATETIRLWDSKPKKAVFFSDSLSALQALTTAEPDQSLRMLISSINILSQTTKIVLQWIPAHTGIGGNEKADRLAKAGSREEQPQTILSYQEVRTLIKNKSKGFIKNKNEGYNPHQDALHHLSRQEETTIFRLRTGHCGLNSHLKRIGVKPSPICPCGEADQTPQHVLQSCPLFLEERKQTWPTETSMKAKLWGGAEDLRLTARFITLTGLRI